MGPLGPPPIGREVLILTMDIRQSLTLLELYRAHILHVASALIVHLRLYSSNAQCLLMTITYFTRPVMHVCKDHMAQQVHVGVVNWYGQKMHYL